jgi:hypothetical protein
MKNYKTLIAIRGFHAGGDIPEGAVVALSADQLSDLHGLVEETDEEPTFALAQLFEPKAGIGIDPTDKDALANALNALGVDVILPFGNSVLDLSDIAPSALLAGVRAKIGTGEITQADISQLMTDPWALTDLAERLGNGLDPKLVASLLPPPPEQAAADAITQVEQASGDESQPAKKQPKKTTPQE